GRKRTVDGQGGARRRPACEHQLEGAGRGGDVGHVEGESAAGIRAARRVHAGAEPGNTSAPAHGSPPGPAPTHTVTRLRAGRAMCTSAGSDPDEESRVAPAFGVPDSVAPTRTRAIGTCFPSCTANTSTNASLPTSHGSVALPSRTSHHATPRFSVWSIAR